MYLNLTLRNKHKVISNAPIRKKFKKDENKLIK